MLYQLRIADCSCGEIKRIQRSIRSTVKRILHLPEWTSTAWMHSKEGGQIPYLITKVMKSKKKATERMLEERDETVRALGNDLDRMQKEVMERCGITEVELERLKEHQEKKRKEEIQGQMNGRAITTSMARSCKRKWLWQNRSLSDGDKIVLVKALSGTLPHRINQTRGRQDQAENKCRKCRNVAETDCVSTNRASRFICDGIYLAYPASSHMLVLKIKPCMSKYKHLYCETANGSLNQLSFI